MKESCGISIAPLSQIDEVAGEIKGARKATLEGKQGLADILPVLSHANARTHAGGWAGRKRDRQADSKAAKEPRMHVCRQMCKQIDNHADRQIDR